MSEKQNVELIQQAYAAFGRGDIPALLQAVSEDVEWEGVYGGGGRIPSAGLRKGREGVREFFTILGGTVDFQRFEPKTFVATGDHVIALGSYAGTIKATGKAVALDWAMHFSVKDGLIRSFREYTDSATAIAAYS